MNWWWQIKSSIINVPRENFCFYDLLLLLRFAMNFRFSRTGKCHRQSLNFNSPRTLNLSLNTTTALSHLDTSRSKRFFSLFLLFFFFFGKLTIIASQIGDSFEGANQSGWSTASGCGSQSTNGNLLLHNQRRVGGIIVAYQLRNAACH